MAGMAVTGNVGGVILFATICEYLIHFDRVYIVWVLSFVET